MAFNLPDDIVGSSIQSALLTLHVNQLDDWQGDGLDISVYRMTQDWVEGEGDRAQNQWFATGSGATWNSYNGPDNGNLSWPGGLGALSDVSNHIYATTTVHAVQEGDVTAYTWPLTDLVQSWDDGESNFGLLLKGTGGLPSDNIYFHTNEASDLDWRPSLSVIYLTEMADLLPGDANADGVVDVSDLAILGVNFNKTGQTLATGDFTGDGIVDVSDLAIVGANWTVDQNFSSTAVSASVKQPLIPEPATAMILTVGLVCLTRQGRH